MTPLPPANAPLPSNAPSGIAIAALIFGLLGLCFPPFILVAAILAILVLVQNRAGKAFAIGALASAGSAFLVWGLLAAIAIPNFLMFQARAKQVECKTNLSALVVAAQSYQAQNDELVTSFEDLDFTPEANAYVYIGGDDPSSTAAAKAASAPNIEQAHTALASLTEVGLTGDCPACALTVACVGNVDRDADLDVWSVSTSDRVSPTGETVPAGEPFHHLDDLTDAAPIHLAAPVIVPSDDSPSDDTPGDDAVLPDPASLSFDDLGLTPRTRAALKKLRVTTVPQLIQIKRASVPPEALDEIETALADVGLAIDDGDDDSASFRTELAMFAHEHTAEVERCYAQALTRTPKLAGRLIVRFIVTTTGEVREVSLDETTFSTPAVGDCVLSVVRTWKTPLRPTEDTPVAYPFVFEPPTPDHPSER